MAIKIAYEKSSGLVLPEAYVRVHKLNTNRTRMSIEYAVYNSQADYEAGKAFEELIHKVLGKGSPEIPAQLDSEGNVIVEAIPEVVGMDNYFSIELLDGNTNHIKQAYLYLMSLPEFATGVEV